MTSTLPSPSQPRSRHCWAVLTPGTPAGGEAAAPPVPLLDLRCHRRLRGPYTGGGALVHAIVPQLLAGHVDLVSARATEVIAIAPELAPRLPRKPQTLTELASPRERSRFYAASRTLRLSHGLTELLMDWARVFHPGGVTIAFRDLDDADPTDLELVSILLRRCDPSLVTVVAETSGRTGELLAGALERHAAPAAPLPPLTPPPAPGADLAQLYVDADGTSTDPALRRAYDNLPAAERARRHTARAEALETRATDGEPALRLGAIPYHLERGTDPGGAGVDALVAAIDDCFARGCYEAVADYAGRGRRIVDLTARPKPYWSLTHKLGVCLSYLERGAEAKEYFAEIRRVSFDPLVHMHNSYQMSMLYTRHLPKEEHDEDQAMEWVNNAIALSDQYKDPKLRVFFGAFARNARALVEMHRGEPGAALDLVNEAINMTDADLDPEEQALHRSVLVYNRAQVLANLGDHAGALADYDEVLRRDPEYGDYYFERAGIYRAAGRYAEALEGYAASIRLSPPSYETHYNRADLLREIGDDEGALADLNYVLELEPGHLDSLVNRTDLLLEFGETERAQADVDHGLALDPGNVHLLCARGVLLADAGDIEAACASYTAALAEDPGFVAAWANRAMAAYGAGRLADAVADLDQAIGLDDDATLRANRAVALADLGEHRRALADLDIAVAALAGEDPDLLYRRGASRHALGDTDGALADWRAHLAAFGPGETSPYAARIEQLAGILAGPEVLAQPAAAESAA